MRTGYLIGIAALSACTSAHAALVIRNTPTKNVSCSANVCTSTRKNAVLNVDQLESLLAASSVVVKSHLYSKDIIVDAALSWTSGSQLTLSSWRSILFSRPLTVAGPGALTLTTSRGDSSGQLTFSGPGCATFWDLSSSLIINGAKYTLVNSLHMLAKAFFQNALLKAALANNYNAKQDGVYSRAPVTTGIGGVFQGLGHTIWNLQINGPAAAMVEAGVFARGSGGTYASVHLVNVSVSTPRGSWANVGSLVGSDVNGSIFNVTATGTVSGVGGEYSTSLGGLAGSIGQISQSSSSVSLSGVAQGDGTMGIGGLAGGAKSVSGSYASGSVTCQTDSGCAGGGLVAGIGAGGSITSSNASGSVTLTGAGGGSAGGLVGSVSGYTGYVTQIAYSHATGNVSVAPQGNAGGLVGFVRDGTIRQSFATGTVTTTGDYAVAGGLVGHIDEESTIADSYALGAVQAGGADSDAGGLLGSRESDSYNLEVGTSYAVGAVGGGGARGGFLGYDFSSGGLSFDYWDLDTSGVSDPSQGASNVPNDPGITGLTDAQLKSGLPSGFDPTIWTQNAAINNGYPYLIANPPQ